MKNQMLSELVRQGDETACLGIVPNPQRAVANRRLGTYACIANRLVAEPPRLKRSDINQLEPWTSRITKRRAIWRDVLDRKSTRLNSSHLGISYAVFCLKKNTIAAASARCT